MRPDTPQHYEYITLEEVEGKTENFLNINPWTQFFDLKGREEIPLSYADHIVIRNCKFDCRTFFNVKADDSQYQLSDFVFENLDIKAIRNGFNKETITNVIVDNVNVELKEK